MTDRDIEMTKSAATAAGLRLQLALGFTEGDRGLFTEDGKSFDPLSDNGDAMWLAVRLRMSIHFDIQKPSLAAKAVDGFVNAVAQDFCIGAAEPCAADPYAATRRAIVRAAAAIGSAA